MNRLILNWDLESREERLSFTHQYIDTLNFELNETELETLANYILWGKTASGADIDDIELPTKFGQKSEVESLDALLESPTFNENLLRGPSDPVYKIPKNSFSRSLARQQLQSENSHLLPIFENLWREIDETELICNFYELANNRRTKPPRDTLLKRFSAEDAAAIETYAKTLKPYDYLRKRRLLIELRRQQYTLKDFYAPPRLSHTSHTAPVATYSDSDPISIRPFPISLNSPLGRLIYNPNTFPNPSDFTEEDLKSISKLIWTPPSTPNSFNFEDPTHLTLLAPLLPTLTSDSPFYEIGQIFQVYKSLSKLEPFQLRIFELKSNQKTNQEIQTTINEEFGKKYTINYISTIYHKSVIEKIAATASLHREVVENLFFPENFKTCIDCGRTLLRETTNFMRKGRSKDGFSPRCKECEKKLRDDRKIRNQKTLVRLPKEEVDR